METTPKDGDRHGNQGEYPEIKVFLLNLVGGATLLEFFLLLQNFSVKDSLAPLAI